MRAGAHFLLMAANPLNRRILRTMLDHPLEMAPGERYRVSLGGQEMLFVGFVVERWLQCAPQGPLDFESKRAERSVAALAEGWSAAVVHMLAREPMTFRQLHGALDDLSRRELRRHLSAMKRAEQVETLPDVGDGVVYVLTGWGRAGIAPLIASARLERRNPTDDMAPIDALDVEAGFRLSLSLCEVPKELTGTCRLGLNLKEEDDPPAQGENAGLTGVTVHIDQGQIVSSAAGLDKPADAWAAGSADDWLDTVIEPDTQRVRTGGDRWLADALLNALHKNLFGVQVT
jgi:DNA-binding HxlR family transcriptional regulator